MSDKAFFDSNILVYIFDPNHPRKSAIAQDLFRLETSKHAATISYQVIHEFLNVALKKSRPPVPQDVLLSAINDIFNACEVVGPSLGLIQSALNLHFQSRFHWYDCLIVAAALESNCDVLYTEDLQDGQQFGQLTVKNPFSNPA